MLFTTNFTILMVFFYPIRQFFKKKENLHNDLSKEH